LLVLVFIGHFVYGLFLIVKKGFRRG
jgi:hypothetical protein